MASGVFWPEADVVEILHGLSLPNALRGRILWLIEERGIADVSATF
jgi:hypothetical protein